MKDKDRWKWFALAVVFLPYVTFMFDDFVISLWVLISPFYYIIVIASVVDLYETFNKEKEGAK